MEENMKKKRLFPSLFPVTVIILSLGLMILSCYLEFNPSSNTSKLEIIEHLGMGLIKEIAIALFILGAISIPMELTDYTKYFLSKLTDIMINDNYIEKLDDEKKKKLKQTIEEQLYFKDKAHDKNSFFYTVQRDVSRFLDGYYYNKYDITVECFFEKDANGDVIIRKLLRKKIEVVNPKHDSIKLGIPIKSGLQSIAGFDDGDILKVKLASVDGMDITKEAIDKIVQCKYTDNRYNLHFSCDLEVDLKGQMVIETVTETIAPITDVHFTHRVHKPCRQYSITMLWHSNEYTIHGYGFGFMDETSNKPDKTYVSNGIILKYNNWILPGDGVLFTILKKELCEGNKAKMEIDSAKKLAAATVADRKQ